jgi:hypothetical protein
VDRGRHSATRSRHDPPSASLARRSRRSERSSCSTCRMQNASAQSVLANSQITLAYEADARATRAAHRRTAVCAGAQRAAAAAALEAQATLPSCGQARSTTTRGRSRRSARELSGTRSRCSFPEAQPTSDPSDTQRRVCSLWVRVPGGKLSQQCFPQPIPQPMSRCKARSRGSSSHLVSGNARQVHRNVMPDDFI